MRRRDKAAAWAGTLAVALLCSLTPTDGPAEAQSVPALIDHYAAQNGVSAWRARNIAWCESRFLNVPNRQGSGAAGIYQFMPRTFAWASHAAGWGGYSVWHVEANVATALWLMGQGQWSHWRACL
jgi:hypothetical protein